MGQGVSDIVQRLRDRAYSSKVPDPLCEQAATEIELLRHVVMFGMDALLRNGAVLGRKTDHDAAPAATAVSTDDRTDKAAPSQCRDRPGDTPVTEPMPKEKRAEVSDRSKPIATCDTPDTPCQDFSQKNLTLTDAERPLGDPEVAVEILRLRVAELEQAIRRLAEQDATLSVCSGAVTVTMDATLTDAEREAIWTAAESYAENDDDPECERIARVMQGLWQRTK